VSSADITDKGVLGMWTSELFGAKNIGCFKMYGVSARTRGEERMNECGHFTDKG